MKLYATLPIPQYKELKNYVDGTFYEEKRPREIEGVCCVKAVSTKPSYCLPCDYIFTHSTSVITNLLKVNFLEGHIVGIWNGGKTHKAVLQELCSEIAYSVRSRWHSKFSLDTLRRVFYFGFRNLDELRTKPPKALVTWEALTLAQLGIEVEDRERRPKGLKGDSFPDVRKALPDRQLNLLIKNLNAIRGAGEWTTTQ